MKHGFLTLCCLAAWLLGGATPATAAAPEAAAVPEDAAQVRFEQVSTDRLHQLAQQQHKLVFIDLYADWCPPCRRMEREVFSDRTVSEFMQRHFVAAKYNVDQATGRALMKRYGRGSIPLYLVFDTSGQLLGRIEGASPASAFIDSLRTILSKKQ